MAALKRCREIQGADDEVRGGPPLGRRRAEDRVAASQLCRANRSLSFAELAALRGEGACRFVWRGATGSTARGDSLDSAENGGRCYYCVYGARRRRMSQSTR